MGTVSAYIRGLDPQLPRPVWRLEAGGLANSLGNGIVLPFTIIYLHDVRDFSYGTAGLVIALLGGVGLVTGPLAGRLVDRVGARLTLIGSLAISAVGFGCFPLVHRPWQAFGLAIVAGAGNGAFAPSHSTLLAAITTREQRNTAFAVQRVTDNLGFGLGGLIGGLIATTQVPESFTLLFLLDAATFLAFVGFLFFVPAGRPDAEVRAARAGGYREALRDRPFIGLMVLITVLVAFGYAQLTTLLPVFAKHEAGVSEAGIGVIFLINTLFIVVAQLPVAKALEGRRRMRALSLAGALFAAAWLLVLADGTWLNATGAVGMFAVAVCVFGLGECLHGAVQNPLIADLAPSNLLGRYMALRTIGWQLGFMVGPAVGGFLLARSPDGLWIASAGACAVAAVLALALDARIPNEARTTPGEPRRHRLAARLSG
ncbi:MAG: MFS transporter [Actinomycetota bacterium]|nr:MFS transporter [Actinomycetota bacterium]